MSCPGLSLRYGHMLQIDQRNGLTLPSLPMEMSRVGILPRSATASLNIVAANHKLRRGKKFKKDKEYPWPDKFPTDGSGPHVFTYINRFKPLEKPPKRVLLPFERPLAEIQRKINEVKKMQKETGLRFERYITLLEIQYNEIMQEIYGSLTPFQRLSVARHPNRPTCLEHVSNISDRWLELHGDRAGYDDPAIVTGIASMDGISFMFVGHQKGRNTKENIHRNFAMPTPHGYRKALRIMNEADQFGLPIITFVDTPGAYADIASERKGQGEAIAQNLRSSFGLGVPVISVVIGEGGSGGALAIGTANRMIMLENSVYFVASPEAAAAILYKSAKAAPKAALRLKITAEELYEFGIADEVVPEPLGGAHIDPLEMSKRIKDCVLKNLRELKKMSPEMLKEDRKAKFIGIGGGQDRELDPASLRKVKKGRPFPILSGTSKQIIPKNSRERRKMSPEMLKDLKERRKMSPEMLKDFKAKFVGIGGGQDRELDPASLHKVKKALPAPKTDAAATANVTKLIGILSICKRSTNGAVDISSEELESEREKYSGPLNANGPREIWKKLVKENKEDI